NILTNAAKYTNEGFVTLSARMDFLEDVPRLKVSVSDTGIGIRKEDLQYLYDSFKRADTRKNLKVEGSGLGLSITKQLVDLMDGEISVDSIYMKGSTFTVILPQTIIDHTPIGKIRFLSRSRKASDEYRQSFEAPEARILIVDDNTMNSMVESKLLGATKMKIDIAKSGSQCLEMAKRKFYHVILLDYMMPEMDGVQTLKQLRKQENGLCRDSAVIALSANSEAEAGHRLMEEGFDGYLEKPIQGAALEAEILKFIPEDIIEYRLRQNDMPTEGDTEPEIYSVSSRRKRKVVITTDCVSDLPEHLIEKYDIGLMYLYVCTESGRFADTLEIASDDLHQYMTGDTSKVTTDSVSVEEYEEFFADMLTKAERVIHISMAKSMGKSHDAARAAAQGFDHVHIIDSAQISCGQGLVALYAGKLAMEGYSAKDICTKVERMKEQIETQFILPSAKIYYQRGFIHKTTARICDWFQLYPILKMRSNGLAFIGTGTGKMENAWRRFIHRRLLRKGKICTDVVFISHAGCSVEQQEYIRREILRRIPFEHVIMHRSSVSTACNTGIGTFGFAYYRNVGEGEFEVE
ncbi:MAG: DegV family EDD domain-containing protein, partial [Lachnospiraceae bacterium]|nr:DegV family EDD domain-containing protein [Lachnospiraceae bacterium]